MVISSRFRFSIAFFVFFFSICILTNAKGNNNGAAANCCGLGLRCSPHIAYQSGACRPRRFMSQQPGKCRQYACAYCYQGSRRFTSTCRRLAIVKQCFGGKVQRQRPSHSVRHRHRHNNRHHYQHRRIHGQCAYRAHRGKIVIPTTSLRTHYPWVKQHGGVTWRPNGGNGIDGMGSGTFCSKVVVDKPGAYYLTVISSAPHPTEHNDLWIKFSAGVRWFKPQGYRWLNKGSGWYKGYQNDGRNKVANYLLTKDFDGHQFITYPLNPGKVYQVCLSGRSSKYTIYKIVMVNCKNWYCSRFSGYMRFQLSRLGSSKCY